MKKIIGLEIVAITLATMVGVSAMASSSPTLRASQWNNNFGIKLFNESALLSSKSNTMFSPVSAYLALSIAANGAISNTEDEMLQTLSGERVDRKTLNSENKLFQNSLLRSGKDWVLTSANSVWAQKRFAIEPEFTRVTKASYNAETQALLGGMSDASRMNEWASKNTNGKIKNIVREGMPVSYELAIMNATYFKAAWSNPFFEAATKPRKFTTADGKTVTVPFMSHGYQGIHAPYFAGKNFQAINLSYGSKRDSVMTIVLPTKQLSDIASTITPEGWAELTEELNKAHGEYVSLYLPKFKYSFDQSIKSQLMAMGMQRAFSPGAQLFDLSRDNGLFFTDARQSTFVATDEKGTEAAAVTIIGGTTSVPPAPKITMDVNRPFFYAITDKVTGAVLFMGTVSNPS